MPLGSARHIDFQLRHAGELVVYGTQKGYGLLDTPGLDAFDQTQFRLRGYSRALVVREGAFTGLTQETNITHAGLTYTIRDIGSAGADGLRRLVVTLGAVPADVATLTIVPASLTVNRGTASQLIATPRNSVGTILPNRLVTWQSSAPLIASVDATGLVTALSFGTATITATCQGVQATCAVTTTQAQDGSIADVEFVYANDLHYWDDADTTHIALTGNQVVTHQDAQGAIAGRHTLTARSNNGGLKPTYDAIGETTQFDQNAQDYEDTDVSADFKLDADMFLAVDGRIPTSIVDTNFAGITSGAVDGTRRLALAVINGKICTTCDTANGGRLDGDVAPSDTQERLSFAIQLAPPNIADPNDPTHNFDATSQSAKLLVETIGGVRQYADVAMSTAGNAKVNFGGIEQFGQFGAIRTRFKVARRGRPTKAMIDALIRRAQEVGTTFGAVPPLLLGIGDSRMAGFGTTNAATKPFIALLGINDATPHGWVWANWGVPGRWMETIHAIAEAWVGSQNHMLRPKLVVVSEMGINDVQHNTSITEVKLEGFITDIATTLTQAGILYFPCTLSNSPGAPSWVASTYNPAVRGLKARGLATDVPDIAGIAELQDTTNPTYIYDPSPGGTGLHWTDAGQLLIYTREAQPKIGPYLTAA